MFAGWIASLSQVDDNSLRKLLADPRAEIAETVPAMRCCQTRDLFGLDMVTHIHRNRVVSQPQLADAIASRNVASEVRSMGGPAAENPPAS